MICTPPPKKGLGLVIGKALLYASLQFAIGSVEMSSKFSVKNFAKDQVTLNHAADALTDYLFVAVIWTIGCSLVLYSNYGVRGLLASVVANLAIVIWITLSYLSSFRYAAKKYDLVVPKLFRSRNQD